MALGRFFSLSLLSLVAMAQTSPPSQDWHAAITRGVELFKHGRYPDAAAAFEQAASLRPDDPVSHLYVGIAWKQQFIPGAIPQDSPDMSAIAAHAEQEFQRALQLDPQNWPALVLLGQFDLERNQFDQARAQYVKARDLDSGNADVFVALGAVAWHQARSVLPSTHSNLQPVVEQGISDLNHALSLDSRNLLAMQWLDALFRLRASLAGSRADLTQADDWHRKAQEAQQEQNRLASSGVISSWPPALAGAWPVLRDFVWFAVRQLPPRPPPPPPPPPDPKRIARMPPKSTSVGWDFRHIPGPVEPPPMLVNPATEERNLLTKVDPVLPPGTKLQKPAVVRLDVVVGPQGHVRAAKVISGDPPMAEAARAAALQWIYRPTLSNGQPVDVRTEVQMTFAVR